jgi:large subunit ribosomal protein L18
MKKVFGTKERPRLSVFRSLRHIHVQIIDDSSGRTLIAASSLDETLKKNYGGNVAAAKLVGKLLAEKAKAKGINRVVFDRGRMRYRGRIKALAEAAREGGLQF